MIYTVNGFVDKNRDAQQDVFFDLLAKSKTKFVVDLCEYRDLLSKVTGLGAANGGGSISKGNPTIRTTFLRYPKITLGPDHDHLSLKSTF